MAVRPALAWRSSVEGRDAASVGAEPVHPYCGGQVPARPTCHESHPHRHRRLLRPRPRCFGSAIDWRRLRRPAGRNAERGRPAVPFALAVPNVADWHPQDRVALLDVATLRYKNRLINRAPAASLRIGPCATSSSWRNRRRQVEFPNALRQTCAQYGLIKGPCARHRGYVNRALLLEEMLAQRFPCGRRGR